MENQQQQQQQTGLCRAGCGFYGSAVTEGLCSKCFKTNLKRTQDSTNCVGQNLSTSLKSVSNDAVNASTSSNITSSGHSLNAAKNLPAKPTMVAKILDIPHSEKPIEDFLKTSQNSFNTLSTSSSSSSFGEQSVSPDVVTGTVGKKPNRCHACKKRVGLTGFLCRCGGLYCSEHRYDKAHDCAFDYKTMEREEIRKNNPVVVSDKIQRL